MLKIYANVENFFQGTFPVSNKIYYELGGSALTALKFLVPIIETPDGIYIEMVLSTG